MSRSSPPTGHPDELWRTALDILHRCEHLPRADRRQFLESATTDPAVLELALELLDNASFTGTSQPTPRLPHDEPQPGERIGRYQILSKLGAGGMGSVYSAEDTELERRVALKFLSADLAGSREAEDKLLREARAASALNHPNIVTVYEVIRSDGRTAIAMEQLTGPSLRTLCGSPLQMSDLLDYGRQIASALAEAHSKSVVHRDIKPENVVLDHTGRLKVVDFGTARNSAFEASTSLHTAGTINYFSPEQARGERATAASDVFALGIVLYELATGVHPFRAGTPLQTLHAVINHEPDAPSARNPAVPTALSRLILDMLRKAPALRPAAGDVVTRLTALHVPATPVSRRWIPIAAALLIAAAGSAIWFARQDPGRITLRALTSADAENRVTAAAIAPDGSQLAYADVTGALFVRTIDDKRTRALRQPPSVILEKLDWFPDLSALLVVGRPFPAGQSSAWIVPLDGAEPRLVRDNIDTASLSPDGSRIAFTSSDSRQIWLAGVSSNNAPTLLTSAAPEESFPVLVWAARGKFLICQRRRHLSRLPNEEQVSSFEPRFRRTYETIDAATGKVAYSRDEIFMRSAAVGADGRMLFLWQNSDAFSTNVWQMQTDPLTGQVKDTPRAVTEFREMAFAGISVSRNGQRLAAVHYQYEPDVYVADFDRLSSQMSGARRVTFDRAHDYPHAFTPDSETVIFESNRNGTFDIFRQRLNQRHADFVAGHPGRDEFNPIVSHDGKWILYASASTADRKDRILQRVPMAGGEPADVPLGAPLDYFDCALPGGKRCVLRTTENQEYAFYDLDPVRGKGAEVARTPWSPAIMGDWSLSPDGAEVAIPNHDTADRFIRVVPLGSVKDFGRVVRLKGGTGMITSVRYSADGTGWFVVLRHADDFFRTSPLLKVDLVFVDRQGNITPLREIPITSWAVAAPRGGRIAFPDGVITGNAVLLER